MKKRRDGSYTEKPLFTLTSSDTIPSLLATRARTFPDQIAVERRSDVGAVRPVTAAELQRMVEETAKGMIGLGVRPGDSVAILSSTSFEWMLLDLAILSAGGVTVPIYESDSAVQISHILTDATVTRVFTATVQQAELVQSVAPEGVPVDSIDRGALLDLANAAKDVTTRQLERRLDGLDIDDVATIIYTSGTTGLPKGVVLTHRNFVGTTQGVRQILREVIDSPDTRLLLFLPLAHVLARFVMHAVLSGQGCLAFSPDIKRLLPDIEAFKPSLLLAVPRVLEKVYNSAVAKAGGGLKGKIFSWSAKQARTYTERRNSVLGPSPLLRMRHGLADRLVLHKIREILGPNIRYVVSGGAPLAADLALFFEGVGITLIQGYGLSETTGPITVQRLDANPTGTVGPVLPGNSMKIAPDGEVLLKGVSLMRGYHRNPEATAEAIDTDGWFHTGDLGRIDRHGHLSITGRKKELIVTAGGKNVSPEILEDALATHPLIANVVVVGDQRPYIGALITLDREMLTDWLTRHGLPVVDVPEAALLPQVLDSLDKAIARANKQVSRAESIRKFRIVDATFTIENGYVTPSMKLRRSAVVRDFAHEIDALYAEK